MGNVYINILILTLARLRGFPPKKKRRKTTYEYYIMVTIIAPNYM